jgi:hypothetical protein
MSGPLCWKVQDRAFQRLGANLSYENGEFYVRGAERTRDMERKRGVGRREMEEL